MLDNAPSSATQAGGRAQISLRGASQQEAGTDADGASRGLAFGSTNPSGQGSSGLGALGQGGDGPPGMAQVGDGGHGFAVSEAAIRAVETEAGNAEAVAARAAGGRMSVETQRGSDQLHGQGFLFNSHYNWGAKNPFTQWVQNTGTAVNPVFTAVPYTPPDRETVWGIGAGSRILRNKLFWFAALDSYQRNDPGLAMVKHPSLCANAQCSEQTGFFAQPSNDQMQALAARLGLSDGAELCWLPQETILFDRARLARRIDVELADGASLLMAEAVVFGRAAMGEAMEQGYFADRWRVRRSGKLIFADSARLDGDIAAKLGQPAAAGGGIAIATVLMGRATTASSPPCVRSPISTPARSAFRPGTASRWRGSAPRTAPPCATI